MKNSVKNVFIILMSIIALSSITPQIVAAASDYVCSDDSSYDPYQSSQGLPSDISYSQATGHEYGKCKDGSLPTQIIAPSKTEECSSSFLGFPTWYRGLVNKSSGNCEVQIIGNGTDGLSKSIWKIVLNVIEAAMMLVGYLSVIFIIYGGVLYITSAGGADGVKKAKSSITNAVIGLVISIVAVAVVEFIFNQLLAGVA